MSEQIPGSFEEFMQSDSSVNVSPEEKEENLESRFSRERLEWGAKIKSMSINLKGNIEKVAELQASIYTERQLALEYYHYLISIMSKLNRSWNTQYSEKWKFYSYSGNERFPNETSKNMRINAELADLKEKRDKVDNHSKFVDNTIKTIDNLIYGLKTRVEIEQIKRGR